MLLSDTVLSISTGDRLTFFSLVDSFEDSPMVFVGDVGHMGEVDSKQVFHGEETKGDEKSQVVLTQPTRTGRLNGKNTPAHL